MIEKNKSNLELYTIQMAKWRLAKELNIPLLDITAKSGLSCFAPLFSNVMAFKRGELSEKEYTKLYLEKMEESKVKFPSHWDKLKLYDKVAIACYCKVDTFCHRYLFRDLLEDYLNTAGINVINKGEINGHQ